MKFDKIQGRKWSCTKMVNKKGEFVFIYRCNYCNKFLSRAQMINSSRTNDGHYFCAHCSKDITGQYI